MGSPKYVGSRFPVFCLSEGESGVKVHTVVGNRLFHFIL